MITEYDLTRLEHQPHEAAVDSKGIVWHNAFSLPLTRELNLRRIDVDNSTTPVSVWVGNNHKAKLLKLQPLE